MSWPDVQRLVKSDYFKLLPILALAFSLAFIPHIDYPYLVHVDEWVQLAYSETIIRAGDSIFANPFYGEPLEGLTGSAEGIGQYLKIGAYLFWGMFHQISGIPWLIIYRYFPGIIFILTVLSVYILAQRQGFGLAAAFFTCLIPTTVGILGPGFLAPVTLALPFIPLSLFLAINFRTGWSYLALFIFTCFLAITHAATAVGLVIVIAPYILLNIKGNFRHSLYLALALAIPFLAPFPWIFSLLLPTIKSLLQPQPLLSYVWLPEFVQTYGYIPTAMCFVGIFLLAWKGERRNYGLILGLLALQLMIVTYATLHYGVTIIFYRGLMYLLLMMSIVAGAGLMGIRNIKLPERLFDWLKSPLIRQNMGIVLCLVIIGVTLAIGIPNRLETSYYHMIDEQDYQAFIWIKENTVDEYQKAILDPWKATAFTALTGKYVYTRIHGYAKDSDKKSYEFLDGGCTNTDFLKKNGISIIYTKGGCDNPDLVEIRKNVYLLKEPTVPNS